MRKAILAGNWKMHGTRQSVQALLEKLAAQAGAGAAAQMVVFPPFVFLEQAESVLKNSAIRWGAQNVAAEKNGAFTGEISAEMLAEFNCEYVLIGHSERRALYGETDAIIAKKFLLAQEMQLTPVLCVGETLAQREQGLTQHIVTQQLQAILDLPQGARHLSNAVLAYEPVWAIGTGLTATPEQAQKVHACLRRKVAEQNPSIAQQLPILYGGSVKAGNAQALFAMPDIDGGLVGGASLDAQEFLHIFQTIQAK